MPRVRQPFSHPGMVPQSAETHASSQITVTLTILILPMPHNFLIPARSPHSPSSAPLRKNHAATVAEIMFRACGFFHMKRLILLFVLTSVAVLAMPAVVAAPLTGARITHIVNDVKTVSPGKPPQSAALNELVEPGKAVRTGIDSRTELLFTDQTITRLGANSHFTVNSGTREISLSKGVMLLQVPKGLGGATIQTNAVTAAITGTTILLEIVNGFTRLTVLEGTCILTLKNDPKNSKTVTAGQQVTAGKQINPAQSVELRSLFKHSPLLAGAWGVQLDQTDLVAARDAQATNNSQELDLGAYLTALGFGNVSGTSGGGGGGGSSASGGVITVVQPNGQVFLYDNLLRFLRVQNPQNP